MLEQVLSGPVLSTDIREISLGAPRERCAAEYVESFADSYAHFNDPVLKHHVDAMIEAHGIRVSDGCNLLLLAARVKPTCLIVCDSGEQCASLAKAIGQLDGNEIHVVLHHDPAVDKFYVICCTSEDKASFINSITRQAGRVEFEVLGRSIVRVSSDQLYHVQLGKFLDVPNCCLVSDPVMPEEADRRFAGLKSAQPDPRINSAVHYSPHLPCCPDCAPTARIGSVYERWVRQEVPDFAQQLEARRTEKPLYLY
ncbi:MAG: hypothetical protein J0M12_04215 [Deltaproteobacteria bacterium]|nr:hypothetical protein [Deltaproteobacteria bacterium]